MNEEQEMERKSLVQQFYDVTDRSGRRELLARITALEGETEENVLRRNVMERRYDVKNGAEVDYFIRGWMLLGSLRSRFWGVRAMRRDAAEVLACWQMDRAESEPGRSVISGELYNMTRLYIELCGRDRVYNSLLWGFGTISDRRRGDKIAEEIVRQTETIPKRLSMETEFALFREAAQAAWRKSSSERA
ncbi:DUF6553 family protein [Lachnoclostridium sp. Marseille-P6806]|uniref:DUF6553 family protein n=1 Tax=Lachnoclostridium sp. Marseille-P6806 TaxID=2364793 RepID=UPI00102F57FF|nr:DUF6553 family protein [Lachnoclostridium sp. Marseille-P6806]